MKFLNSGKKPLPADMAELFTKFKETAELFADMVKAHQESLQTLKQLHMLAKKLSKYKNEDFDSVLQRKQEIMKELSEVQNLIGQFIKQYAAEAEVGDQMREKLIAMSPTPKPQDYHPEVA